MRARVSARSNLDSSMEEMRLLRPAQRARNDGIRSYFGSRIRNVVPTPGVLCFTYNLPLWYSSMIRLESVNPSPHPRFFVL